jgi:hypothetical protein
MHPLIRKITAVLLLLLFLEKAELRLWIHDCLHESNKEVSIKNDKVTDKHFSKIGCDCLEDFFVPLTYTEEISIIPPPAIDYNGLFTIHYKSFISSSLCFYFLLRGPPTVA